MKKNSLIHVKYLLSILSLVVLVACSSSSIQTDRPYQNLGLAKHFIDFQDGYLIAIEKRNKTGDNSITNYNNQVCFTGNTTSDKDDSDGYQTRFQLRQDNHNALKPRNKHFKMVMCNQGKIMAPTHITAHFGGIKYLHNAYNNSISGKYDYEEGFKGLTKLKSDLSKRLACESKEGNCTPKYSHILVMSMGWNNDQLESVYRYNLIKKNLLKVSKKEHNENFNPLIIGFSWPSVWGALEDNKLKKKFNHLISYFTKADDADEIGYSYANLLINKLLPEVVGNLNQNIRPKVVVIGHSFGARLLSRAIFAEPHLLEPCDIKNVSCPPANLYIGLQGAFSANRFLPNGGNEGYPYSDFKKLKTPIVLTTSQHDDANPVAYWITRAGHVGGNKGLEIAKENHKDIFEVFDMANRPTSDITFSNDKVLMIEASKIIDGKDDNHSSEYRYSAHNDILDNEMAELLYKLLSNL